MDLSDALLVGAEMHREVMQRDSSNPLHRNASSPYKISTESILEACKRIAPYSNRTMVATCSTLDARVTAKHGAVSPLRFYFKCESFQKGGAFKFRGACNAIMGLPEEQAQKGVISHSSGNHAQAVALAARARGVSATIVMPDDAPEVKVKAVRGYGAKIVQVPPLDRDLVCIDTAARTGETLVHPYDNRYVMSGQGTIFVEFNAQTGGKLDGLIVPVGGAGMLSGVTVAAKAFNPKIKIFGVEPEAADDAFRSKIEGSIQPHRNNVAPETSASRTALRTTLGEKTWPIVRDLVDEILLVSEEEIMTAMRFVLERMKLVIEPSAACGVAAAMGKESKKLSGLSNIGIILCGGNVDLNMLGNFVAAGAKE